MDTTTLAKGSKLTENRTLEDVRQKPDTEKADQASRRTTRGLLFDVISSVLIILIGFAVFKISGLYDGIDSAVVKIILGTAISVCYLLVFKYALYLR